MCISSFNFEGLTVSQKSVTKNLVLELERKKNEEIKDWIHVSTSSLIPVNTLRQYTVHVCTKFQMCRHLSPRGQMSNDNIDLWYSYLFMYPLDQLFLKTKVLHGPLLWRGLRKALQQINTFYIAMSSSAVVPYFYFHKSQMKSADAT